MQKNMHKKAQAAQGVGMFITLFITIIVGVILLIATAQSVGQTLDTGDYSTAAGDAAVTLAANGDSVDLTGQDLLDTIVLHDTATGAVVDAGNYTTSEIVSTTTGVKTISIQTDDAEYASTAVNMTYTYGPDGYVENSGARGMIGLIVVMFALAIAVIAMSPTIRSGLIDGIGK